MGYDLRNKKVVVTAGGSGIGFAIAEKCLEAGADVYICDISESTLNEALKINKELKGTIADIGNSESVIKFFEQVYKEFGRIDVLVNNAGIAGPIKALEDISVEEWKKTIDVNLNGMFYCIKQVIPKMKEQKSGNIINISTRSAQLGMVNRSPYVASKSGVLGLTTALTRELGPFNIRCNAVLPGGVSGNRLEMLIANMIKETGKTRETIDKELVEFVSMRKLVNPKDVGDMVVFLASESASIITGQMIAVDGNLEWED